jgi:glycyl-tRNA synthetase beta chain
MAARGKKAKVAPRGGARAQKTVPHPATLLVELLTEELPPKSLQQLSDSFAGEVQEGLRANAFLALGSLAKPFATPRRLAVIVSGVYAVQPDRSIERKGPAVIAGFDGEGKPTPALLGFAKSCGVAPEKLERRLGDKGEQFVHVTAKNGEPLAMHLPAIVEAALKKLPVAKLMRWGDRDAQFVRPVHGVILLHGGKVIPGTVLGIRSGNKTLGHRFLSRGAITIPAAERYAAILRARGKVIANFDERRDSIEAQLNKAVARDEQVLPDETTAPASDILARNLDLIEEVAALVEAPKVYVGRFDRAFLDVPPECLALSMQSHQRYFPVVTRKDPTRLTEKFLIVSNNELRDPRNIIGGNERVLRARLADARFFYDQDRKHRLDDLNVKLDHVVYHNKLGSQWERVERIRAIAERIAAVMSIETTRRGLAGRAATLAKLDLVTEMVGEFPELQGVMGFYYAREHEDLEVATAIREHYLPRFSGDLLPQSDIGACLALADRLELLVGMFGIGEKPSGEKDPYGLRRAALGVLRILIESEIPLDLPALLEDVAAQFPAGRLADGTTAQVYEFILDRLRPYLRDQDFGVDEIEAVLALRPARLDDAIARVRAVHEFRALPAAESLAAANKRIRNILRQAGAVPNGGFDPARAAQDEERALGVALAAIRSEVEESFARADYEGGLKKLAGLRPAVDAFFDKVLVMHDDEAIRRNRLALLAGLSNLFLGVADISRLQS